MSTKSLTGRQRRRMRAILRKMDQRLAMYGHSQVFLYYQSQFRYARRLGECGLACPVASKTWFGVGRIKEVTMFRTREEASKRYPSWTMPPRSRRGC